MSDDLRVLFVCTANICRSAYAHVRAQSPAAAKAGLSIDSAGTWGFDAAPMDAEMAAQAKLRGADPEGFASHRIGPADVRDADLILTMESAHRSFIMDDWPAAFRKTFTLGQFRDIVERADADLTGRELIAAARNLRLPARPDDDVRDPYGQGTEAAAECAAQIDAILDVVLPRLARNG